MSATKESKSRCYTKYIIGAAISLSILTAYTLYKTRCGTAIKHAQQCKCKDSKNAAKPKRKQKKKQCIKLSSNYKCLTLELSNKFNEYKSKLNPAERSQVKTRKDNTCFLIYCSNCLQPGHDATKCHQRHKICVAGDSHTSVWGVASRFYVNTDIVRVRIAGMSAQGLVNQNSTLKSSNKIVRAFRNCHDGNSGCLFIQIGQVDIDYVWYFRQMKYENAFTFEQQIGTSIDNLFAFLHDTLLNHNEKQNDNVDANEAASMSNVKIVIHGVHLPPLGNEEMKGKLYHHFIERCRLTKEYLDEHLVLPSHVQRTQMALQFNRRLKEKCKEYGYYFVEISTEILDERTGVVDQKYVKQDEVDIHLNPQSLIPMYHKKFKELKLDFAVEIDDINAKMLALKNELKQRFEV